MDNSNDNINSIKALNCRFIDVYTLIFKGFVFRKNRIMACYEILNHAMLDLFYHKICYSYYI